MTITDLYDDLEEEKSRFEKIEIEHRKKIYEIHNKIHQKIVKILEKKGMFDNILTHKNKRNLWKEYSPEFHLGCGRLSVYHNYFGITEIYLHPVRIDNNHTDRRYAENIATIYHYTKVIKEDLEEEVFNKLTVMEQDSLVRQMVTGK